MKQLIVLISTIILGIFISAIVLGFRGKAATLQENTNTKLDNLIKSYDSGKCIVQELVTA